MYIKRAVKKNKMIKKLRIYRKISIYMNKIKKFADFVQLDEAAIMPRDIESMIASLRTEIARKGLISLYEANDIAEEYGVIFIDYNDFYESLRDDLKHTAPPRDVPVFGFFREDGMICIVVTGVDRRGIESMPSISAMNLGFINHIIQHESIHTEQWRRREGRVEYTLPDPKDRKLYFSNKDEIMAFAQSMVEMMMTQDRLTDISQLQRALNRNPLWQDIKKSGISDEVKNKYLKYVYEYANNYLKNDVH
jgi:hypothetical protein